MQYKYPKKDKNISLSKHILSWNVILLASFLVIGLFVETAHASIISLVNSVFGSAQVSARIIPATPSNSQTITILQAAVNIDPNPDKVMQFAPPLDDGKTLIPGIAAVGGSDESVSNTQISIYVVREGDSLSTISDIFGVSVNTIIWANDISRSTPLQAGQILVILPVTGINYSVKKGETISGIISKYKANLEEVLQYNDLTAKSDLAVGQTIIIPDVDLQVSTPIRAASTIDPLRGADVPSYPGYYIRPLKIGTKSQGLHGHNGVDLAAPIGTPIYAAADGKIIVSSTGNWSGGYGNFVIISHANGTQTVYAHNSKNIVKVGEYVEQGQEIARVGSTGNSTGPHVHFEIRGAKNPF